MAVVYKDLVPPTQLTTSTTTPYTAGTSTRALIIGATVTNTSGSAATVTIYLVPDGGSAGDSTTIVYQKSIPTGADPYIVEGLIGKTIAPAGMIKVVAGSNSALTLHVSGAEFS